MLARHDFYNKDYIHADTEVCFDILQNADFGFVYQVLSYTRRHNESVSSFSTMVNTHKFNHLYLALKYGPVYLDDQELTRVVKTDLNTMTTSWDYKSLICSSGGGISTIIGHCAVLQTAKTPGA
jgi:hypothetical protein